jgi:hypothetical protein
MMALSIRSVAAAPRPAYLQTAALPPSCVRQADLPPMLCLPCRRLELFGEERNIRDGWVTVGRSLPTSNFRPEVYASHFRVREGVAPVDFCPQPSLCDVEIVQC